LPACAIVKAGGLQAGLPVANFAKTPARYVAGAVDWMISLGVVELRERYLPQMRGLGMASALRGPCIRDWTSKHRKISHTTQLGRFHKVSIAVALGGAGCGEIPLLWQKAGRPAEPKSLADEQL
jgi:hypothetical protein